MKKNTGTVDLLHGSALSALTRLSVPIMATSLIQMAYNLTDMIWIGRVGSNAVAAVGAAGMYMWLFNGLAILAKMGGQVLTGHALGAGKPQDARNYARASLQMAAAFAITSGMFCVIFAKPLIGFFRLTSPQVIADAEIYTQIICGLAVFSFLNQTLTGLFTAMGNSRSAFLATTTGLVINICLDPLLIFGWGPIPALRVAGAAIATIFAQFIVFLIFLYFAHRDGILFRDIQPWKLSDFQTIKVIVKIGLPTAAENILFNVVYMIIARMIAGYGDAAVAVEKVGSQIESISWMTADGISAAINAFIAQNHGAGQQDRIRKGYFSAMKIVLVWGIFCTALLTLCSEPIFRVFITEEGVIPMGISYLQILGLSQLFMSVAITVAGAFSGYGRTLPPSVISALFVLLRIPLAMALTRTPLALDGIWWSITISTIMRGIIMFVWFGIYLGKKTRQSLHSR